MNSKLLLIAGILTTLVAIGCSPETRYRTLSFFFDGVPNPDGTTPVVSGDKRGTQSKKDIVKISTHGPYAARLCEACHMRGGSNKLILPVEKLCLNCHELNTNQKHVHGPVASGGCRVCHDPHGSGKAFLLVSDPTTFCFYCHDEAEIKTREVHASTAGTQCTDCHNPHSSDNDFMLK